MADAGGPYTGEVGTAVDFDGSTSADPDGSIVSWDWDFGDGNTGTGEMTNHTYAAAGSYTVTLTVTDDGGLNDTATTTATIADAPVGNQPPTGTKNRLANSIASCSVKITLFIDEAGNGVNRQ